MIKKLAKIILEKTHLVIHLLFFFNVCASKHSKDPAEFSFALSWRRCYCVNSLGFSKYLNFYFTLFYTSGFLVHTESKSKSLQRSRKVLLVLVPITSLTASPTFPLVYTAPATVVQSPFLKPVRHSLVSGLLYFLFSDQNPLCLPICTAYSFISFNRKSNVSLLSEVFLVTLFKLKPFPPQNTHF